jgi:pantoate kinase
MGGSSVWWMRYRQEPLKTGVVGLGMAVEGEVEFLKRRRREI